MNLEAGGVNPEVQYTISQTKQHTDRSTRYWPSEIRYVTEPLVTSVWTLMLEVWTLRSGTSWAKPNNTPTALPDTDRQNYVTCCSETTGITSSSGVEIEKLWSTESLWKTSIKFYCINFSTIWFFFWNKNISTFACPSNSSTHQSSFK